MKLNSVIKMDGKKLGRDSACVAKEAVACLLPLSESLSPVRTDQGFCHQLISRCRDSKGKLLSGNQIGVKKSFLLSLSFLAPILFVGLSGHQWQQIYECDAFSKKIKTNKSDIYSFYLMIFLFLVCLPQIRKKTMYELRFWAWARGEMPQLSHPLMRVSTPPKNYLSLSSTAFLST